MMWNSLVMQYINHRVYDHFNLSDFSLQKPQRSTRGVQCVPSIKANKLKYNLSNYTPCGSVGLPQPKCKPRMCCKCIIIGIFVYSDAALYNGLEMFYGIC